MSLQQSVQDCFNKFTNDSVENFKQEIMIIISKKDTSTNRNIKRLESEVKKVQQENKKLKDKIHKQNKLIQQLFNSSISTLINDEQLQTNINS